MVVAESFPLMLMSPPTVPSKPTSMLVAAVFPTMLTLPRTDLSELEIDAGRRRVSDDVHAVAGIDENRTGGVEGAVEYLAGVDLACGKRGERARRDAVDSHVESWSPDGVFELPVLPRVGDVIQPGILRCQPAD